MSSCGTGLTERGFCQCVRSHFTRDFSENHTAKGVVSIYAGLLSLTGESGDYVFGDMSTGLQLAMSENTFFEDFGVAAGVATNSQLFPIPTTLGDDSRYVVTVIPEPGSLALVGIGLLCAVLRFRRGGERRRRG